MNLAMKSIVSNPIFIRIAPILLLFVLSISTLPAQKANKTPRTNKIEKLLVGSWKLDYDQSISKANRSSRLHYDSLSSERKSRIINSFSKRRVTFKADGTYILTLTEGNQVTGTWKLPSDDGTLHIRIDGKLIVQRVENINRSIMILDLGGDKNANRMFRKWYLNKTVN